MSGFRELGLRPGLEAILRCPTCLGELSASSEALVCPECESSFPVRDGVPFAFRPAELDQYIQLDDRRQTRRTDDAPSHLRGGGYHWKTYGFQGEIPRVEGGLALLHGCGDGGERRPLEELGFEVLGFDVKRTRGTDFLGDAHCLPLADASLNLVLSTQVFEHLAAPWVAASEIARVLKPGGWLVGSVAFLKPFHSSYFHISHLGMVRLLEPTGLIVDRLRGAQSLSYSMYGGLLPIGGRRLRRTLLGAFDMALMTARGLLWSLRRRRSAAAETDVFDRRFLFSFRDFDKLRFAPAVVFRAQKPSTEEGRRPGPAAAVPAHRSAVYKRAIAKPNRAERVPPEPRMNPVRKDRAG